MEKGAAYALRADMLPADDKMSRRSGASAGLCSAYRFLDRIRHAAAPAARRARREIAAAASTDTGGGPLVPRPLHKAVWHAAADPALVPERDGGRHARF